MFEIKGLDKLTKTLDELQKLSAELDGELGTIEFDARDTESVDQAIAEMETMVDNKFEEYSSNSVAVNIADSIKSSFRQMIEDKANKASVEVKDNSENEGLSN